MHLLGQLVEQADLAADEHDQPGKVRPLEAVPNCRTEIVAAELRGESAKGATINRETQKTFDILSSELKIV